MVQENYAWMRNIVQHFDGEITNDSTIDQALKNLNKIQLRKFVLVQSKKLEEIRKENLVLQNQIQMRRSMNED